VAHKTPQILESGNYEELGVGPDDDTGSYEISLGNASPRFSHKKTARASTAPALDRRSLQRSDGGGGVPTQHVKVPWYRYLAIVGAVCLTGAAIVLFRIGYTASLPGPIPVPVEQEPPPDSISGVEVRQGIGSTAEE